MPFEPKGFAPVIPGLTRTEGPESSGDVFDMLSMLLGKGQKEPAVTDKMAQVVQLLREIAQEDPRIAPIAGDALRALIEGPPPFLRGSVAGQGPAGPAVSSVPMGGPGATSF